MIGYITRIHILNFMHVLNFLSYNLSYHSSSHSSIGSIVARATSTNSSSSALSSCDTYLIRSVTGRGHGVGAGSLAVLDGGIIYLVYLIRSISFEKVCGIIGTSICYIIWYVLHVYLILVFLDLAPSCGHYRVKGYKAQFVFICYSASIRSSLQLSPLIYRVY